MTDRAEVHRQCDKIIPPQLVHRNHDGPLKAVVVVAPVVA